MEKPREMLQKQDVGFHCVRGCLSKSALHGNLYANPVARSTSGVPRACFGLGQPWSLALYILQDDTWRLCRLFGLVPVPSKTEKLLLCIRFTTSQADY